MSDEEIQRKIGEKPFYVHNVRGQLDLLHQEEISFSKMVENLNEMAYEFYKEKNNSKFNFSGAIFNNNNLIK